jgi:epothilone synthetase B
VTFKPSPRELERLEFRLSQPGLRRLPKAYPRTPLTAGETVLTQLASIERRSRRRFGTGAIGFGTFGTWLDCLTSRTIPDAPFPKYGYASAGDLYSVRAHLYVKPRGIEGVVAGYYYHDPKAHSLVMTSDTPALEAVLFGPNRDIFTEASFALFLTAQMRAVRPIYGHAAMRFVCIEAGLMTQLLELRAAELSLATCQLGNCPVRTVRCRLRLEEGSRIVHTMVGGLPAD